MDGPRKAKKKQIELQLYDNAQFSPWPPISAVIFVCGRCSSRGSVLAMQGLVCCVCFPSQKFPLLFWLQSISHQTIKDNFETRSSVLIIEEVATDIHTNIFRRKSTSRIISLCHLVILLFLCQSAFKSCPCWWRDIRGKPLGRWYAQSRQTVLPRDRWDRVGQLTHQIFFME